MGLVGGGTLKRHGEILSQAQHGTNERQSRCSTSATSGRYQQWRTPTSSDDARCQRLKGRISMSTNAAASRGGAIGARLSMMMFLEFLIWGGWYVTVGNYMTS